MQRAPRLNSASAVLRSSAWLNANRPRVAPRLISGQTPLSPHRDTKIVKTIRRSAHDNTHNLLIEMRNLPDFGRPEGARRCFFRAGFGARTRGRSKKQEAPDAGRKCIDRSSLSSRLKAFSGHERNTPTAHWLRSVVWHGTTSRRTINWKTPKAMHTIYAKPSAKPHRSLCESYENNYCLTRSIRNSPRGN